MSTHSLAKKQFQVLEDLFTGQMNEQEVLKKHKVSRYIYTKWLNDKNFIEYFYQRMKGFSMQSSLIVSRYAPVAAARLVELTESDKDETARKACLDVISIPDKIIEKQNEKENIHSKLNISDEAAAKVMEILADDKQSTNKQNTIDTSSTTSV